MDLKDLNQYKHLPPKEFDAKLAEILKAQADARRATTPPVKKKKLVLKKTGGK